MSSRSMILIGFLGLTGCAHERRTIPATADDEGQFTPASRVTGPDEVTPKQQSLFAISDYRCDRETRCGNVGQGKPAATHDACVAAFNAAGYDALETQECPNIDEAALSQCLAAIRLEDCSTAMDSITVLDDCRPSTLCVH